MPSRTSCGGWRGAPAAASPTKVRRSSARSSRCSPTIAACATASVRRAARSSSARIAGRGSWRRISTCSRRSALGTLEDHRLETCKLQDVVLRYIQDPVDADLLIKVRPIDGGLIVSDAAITTLSCTRLAKERQQQLGYFSTVIECDIDALVVAPHRHRKNCPFNAQRS